MKLATEERRDQETARPDTRNARLGGTDIFRGALVIVTAILIGGFVISRGLDQDDDEQLTSPETEESTDAGADGDGAADGSETGDQTANSTETTSPAQDPAGPTDEATVEPDPAEGEPVDGEGAEVLPEETSPEVPALRPPAEVKVLVLNGAQTQGIAARGTEVLLAASYQTAAPKNARTQRPSSILYADGYQAEAMEVATAFGPGLEDLVQPIDPADLPIDDTQGANVIVVIGNDSLIPIQ